MGYHVATIPFHLDKNILSQSILSQSPDVVFNLVESVKGSSKDIYLAPRLLEELKIPFTGCSAEALRITTDKIHSKKILRANNIPTPAWFSLSEGGVVPMGGSLVVKPRDEDASLGINSTSFVSNYTERSLKELLLLRERESGLRWFAEEYIEPREFNVSVLCSLNRTPGFQVLPPAEIRFTKYFDNRPKILDYDAKWNEDSVAYRESLPSFDYHANDFALIENVRGISARCWDVFRLSGYARVDLRVDSNGNPYVLEINADPGISPGAGFVLACKEAGISYKELILLLVKDALARAAR